jgi:hypothetical protein
MKKRLAAALTTILFVALCLVGTAAAEPALNGVLTRYPGAVRVEGEKVDAYYLSHGWLTRQAAYQSPDDLENVMRWYAAYLPQAEMHETGTCVALRQTQTFVHILHTISVLLCQLPPGTRILVKEDVFLSP